MQSLRDVRSLLFVPGDDSRKLAKAASVPADVLIVDWEDAVSPERRQAAHRASAEAVPMLRQSGRSVLVRVNAGEAGGDDLAPALECQPDGIVFPKCESPHQVSDTTDALPDGLAVALQIESPIGLDLAGIMVDGSSRVGALMFGAEDYCVAVGISRSDGEPELAFARGRLLMLARARGVEAFDSPCMQYRDSAVVREAAWRARRFGFTGQAAIHPGQVPVINEVFDPSDEEIAHARAVLERARTGPAVQGNPDGELEDRPAVLRAREILGRKGLLSDG